MSQKIRTYRHLKSLASEEVGVNVFALVGEARVSKRLWFDGSNWDVFNEIDKDFQESIPTQVLRDETLILDAMKAGSLYQYSK